MSCECRRPTRRCWRFVGQFLPGALGSWDLEPSMAPWFSHVLSMLSPTAVGSFTEDGRSSLIFPHFLSMISLSSVGSICFPHHSGPKAEMELRTGSFRTSDAAIGVSWCLSARKLWTSLPRNFSASRKIQRKFGSKMSFLWDRLMFGFLMYYWCRQIGRNRWRLLNPILNCRWGQENGL